MQKVANKTQLADCGPLSDSKWPGWVSAQALLDDHSTTDEILADAVERLNDFYVKVNERAPTRCIDGRHDPNLDENLMGPQVPGGAPGAALAYRLGVDKDDLTRGSFLDDAESMISEYIRLGLSPGGHRDDASHDALTIGCGAIDGMNTIVRVMTDPKYVNDHKRIVKLLFGRDFNRDDYLRVMGAAVVINGRSDDYFRDRAKILDYLEAKAPHSVSTLHGVHKEGVVIVNFVAHTTLASNRFAQTFEGVQAFGYDIWRSREIARKLLPHPDQENERRHFVMARVMYTVATLMALTDGTQKLILRTTDSPSLNA